MGGRKKYPRLSKNLDRAIRDLARTFEVEVKDPAKRAFIERIRRRHDRFTGLEIGAHRMLCWTRERNTRKLIFQSGNRSPEERIRFASWREMEAAKLIHRRGIKVSMSHASPEDIRWGADASFIEDEESGASNHRASA